MRKNSKKASKLIREAQRLASNGDYSKARDICQKASRADGLNPDLWLLMGAIEGQMDMFVEACRSFQVATELASDNFFAHYNLGFARQSIGNISLAIDSYNVALELNPKSIETLSNLAGLYYESKDYEKAVTAFEAAVELNPELPQLTAGLARALFMLGEFTRTITVADKEINSGRLCGDDLVIMSLLSAHAYLKLDDYDAARLNCSRALSISPGSVDGLVCLSDIAFNEGKINKALQNLLIARSLQKTSADVLGRLAKVYQIMGRNDLVIDNINSITDKTDKHYCCLAISLEMEGKVEQAVEAYKAALELCPENEEAMSGIAHLYEKQSRFEDARSLLQPVIKANGSYPGIYNTYADILRHEGKPKQAIQLLEQFLERCDGSQIGHIQVHYSLGRLYDDLKNYDAAFRNYDAANELTRLQGYYDHSTSNYTKLVDDCMSVFSSSNFPCLQNSGNMSTVPVFIVGMPRSGTSLAEQIISSHPLASGAGELPYIYNFANIDLPNKTLASDSFYPENVKSISHEDLSGFADTYLTNILADTGEEVQRVTDKLPGNFWYLGLIELLFPNAKIVHCKRDPIDTCLSVYFQNFSATHSYSTSLESLAEYYIEYLRMMDHWKSVLSLQVFDLDYSHLINDHVNTVRSLIDFCDLPWDDSCLKFHTSKRFVNTPSYHQVRKPIYTDSLGRWKNYEKHIKPLLDAFEV